MSNKPHRYPIGTSYQPRRKHTYTVTITDRLTVTNDSGVVIKTYYQGTHEFCGQAVTNSNITDTEISMGLSA
jgi:hypothetical protein